jgi:ABC-type lipoprotein export system ATPase subunit
VFDALDAQGQTDVAAALGEMAQDRMVLVVTHSPELAKALRPKAKIHVGLVEGVAKVTTS